MKTTFRTFLILGGLTAGLVAAPILSMADDAVATAMKTDPVVEQIQDLQRQWAIIKYQTKDDDAQLEALHKLEEHAARVTASYADRAEPKIWLGIILATDAGISGGFGALGKVREAKALFEAALAIDPQSLAGSAHTSLGSLYYQVPGWPIAFGDDGKAEDHLKQALRINPDGIDPNFFYGDFLIGEGRFDEAEIYLQRAFQAPSRPDRPVADKGRRLEIIAAQNKLQEKQSSRNRPNGDK